MSGLCKYVLYSLLKIICWCYNHLFQQLYNQFWHEAILVIVHNDIQNQHSDHWTFKFSLLASKSSTEKFQSVTEWMTLMPHLNTSLSYSFARKTELTRRTPGGELETVQWWDGRKYTCITEQRNCKRTDQENYISNFVVDDMQIKLEA